MSAITQTEKLKMRTWVEIDRSAIAHNMKTFRGMLGKNTWLMSVVKSNAYGHGLVMFAKEAVKCGVDALGVDSYEEALELRQAKIKIPILVFGYTAPAYYKEASMRDIMVTVSSLESLKTLPKFKSTKKLKVHIKADTGLGRQGFPMESMPEVIQTLQKSKSVEVAGLYSHLAIGEDPSLSARKYTKMQAERLDVWASAFQEARFKFKKHLCATSSTMFYPEYHFDMVRVGIGSYGLWPSPETKEAMGKKYTLRPVLSWKAIISETRKMSKGSKISYDLTEELKRDSLLGIVPVGYWHGYPRALSRKGVLNYAGNRAKVLGTVCMDMIIIDLTGTKAKAGDEVSIIGGPHGHWAEADMLASDADTINYEIVTRINPIIKRFYRINPELKRFVV